MPRSGQASRGVIRGKGGPDGSGLFFPPEKPSPAGFLADQLRRVVINHCSPVLMGFKPASLFALRSGSCVDCLEGILPRNLGLFVLRRNARQFLVMVYEKRLLRETLSSGSVRVFLSDRGYPAGSSLAPMLYCLKERFGSQNFPHEVGLFLGYPLEDVSGFIEHEGRNCKFCGYWKVYGDVEKAKSCFRQYDYCREYMKGRGPGWVLGPG